MNEFCEGYQKWVVGVEFRLLNSNVMYWKLRYFVGGLVGPAYTQYYIFVCLDHVGSKDAFDIVIRNAFWIYSHGYQSKHQVIVLVQ